MLARTRDIQTDRQTDSQTDRQTEKCQYSKQLSVGLDFVFSVFQYRFINFTWREFTFYIKQDLMLMTQILRIRVRTRYNSKTRPLE